MAGKILGLNTGIDSLLVNKAMEYDKILADFSVSECDHATALREQLAKEQETVNTLAMFYKSLISMLAAASADLDLIEEHFSKEHVTN